MIETLVVVSKVSVAGSRREDTLERCSGEHELWWAACGHLEVQRLVCLWGFGRPPCFEGISGLLSCQSAQVCQ